ncbi:transcriptional regulator PpsR [Tranquillimonas alkanivorans]|uniref:Transcriptional regulator PpsR n=1 Tax=Tranquillimonas alkanivorans TaxID=441119 RepID=A0A1I5LD12_9RHOB|nr:transcriptional regulator PpsR [Tranquillimonas alkanivorans]SFO95190.1 transcriptional regulator PpsR [Tranquillimonas alkanivorans]
MTSRGTKYWSSGSIPLIAPELLGDIISATADVAVVISDMGRVLSVLVNPGHAAYGRLDHWEGRDIREFLTIESVAKLDAQLAKYNNGEGAVRPVELNHTDGMAWEFPVRYSFHAIGPDGALLMLGRDLQPIAEMQQQLVKAQMALERDYEAQRDYDTRLRVLLETTDEAVIFVSAESGRILDLNRPAAKMLGGDVTELSGAPFAQEFEGRRRGEFLESLAAAAASDAHTTVSLTARRSERKLSMEARVFRAAGERMLLCRVEASDGQQDVPDVLGANLAALFSKGADGIVFTDRAGMILSANDSFLALADVAQAAGARGRSLADFLSRGSVDLKVLIDNAARAGHMRLYSTKLVTEYGSQIAVELSATYLNDRSAPAVAFVVRDASRVDAVRQPGVPLSDDGMRSMMELVGSATLKDIVSETTDVIEKMCIETAVELTRNNRVAAAEMLGLSRQSLYVKLRKYGLLNKGD